MVTGFVRTFTRAALAGAVLLALAPQAQAQTDNYPNRPIRIVVGFAPGGGNDLFARVIGPRLSERLGQPVVIENKPGAGGRAAAEFVAREPADGYTVLIGASGAMAIGPVIYKTNYQTLKSFIPVSMVADFPLLLAVHASHPARNVQELVAWTKANPEKTNYATSSPAFTLPTELFKMRTGARGVGIPYKSSGESLLSVISGQSTMTIADPPPAAPLVQDGRLRALAVTAKSRAAQFPDVPTMAEAGVADVEVGLWSGFFVPAGTPSGIVSRLEAEFRHVVLNTDAGEKLKGMAVNPVGGSAAEFAKAIEAEIALWTGVVKAGNLTFNE
jgi:tripartite-type tricarboxylate transporter receptor subunit TctC